MNTILGKLGGRKFLMAIVTVIAVALSSYLGWSETTIITTGSIVVSYILGQSVADGLSGGATSTVTQAAQADQAPVGS